MAFIATALLASCNDKDNDYSGDFGQIKVPDTRQLEQTVDGDKTQSDAGVTFTTEGAWTSSIAETRAEAPGWITISPDHGDAAGNYTIRINLEPNTGDQERTATISIVCGSSRIEIVVTQKGSEDPSENPEPISKWLIDRIECYFAEENADRRLLTTYIFEYDQAKRLTLIEETDHIQEANPQSTYGYSFTYPDSRTIEIESLPTDNREYYTITLDAQGRATAFTASRSKDDTDKTRQTIAYNADGYCSGIRQFGPGSEESSHYSEFTWKSGNLTAVNVFNDGGVPATDYDYTIGYSGYKNDATAMNLDLNAFFGCSPTHIENDGCTTVLALIDRMGRRSANLTTSDLMNQVSSQGADDGTWLYYVRYDYAPIVWTLDAEGRATKAVSVHTYTPVKEHLTTHEIVVTGTTGTNTETYELHYTK